MRPHLQPKNTIRTFATMADTTPTWSERVQYAIECLHDGDEPGALATLRAALAGAQQPAEPDGALLVLDMLSEFQRAYGARAMDPRGMPGNEMYRMVLLALVQRARAVLGAAAGSERARREVAEWLEAAALHDEMTAPARSAAIDSARYQQGGQMPTEYPVGLPYLAMGPDWIVQPGDEEFTAGQWRAVELSRVGHRVGMLVSMRRKRDTGPAGTTGGDPTPAQVGIVKQIVNTWTEADGSANDLAATLQAAMRMPDGWERSADGRLIPPPGLQAEAQRGTTGENK